MSARRKVYFIWLMIFNRIWHLELRVQLIYHFTYTSMIVTFHVVTIVTRTLVIFVVIVTFMIASAIIISALVFICRNKNKIMQVQLVNMVLNFATTTFYYCSCYKGLKTRNNKYSITSQVYLLSENRSRM